MTTTPGSRTPGSRGRFPAIWPPIHRIGYWSHPACPRRWLPPPPIRCPKRCARKGSARPTTTRSCNGSGVRPTGPSSACSA
jgi:hypothetical protein